MSNNGYSHNDRCQAILSEFNHIENRFIEVDNSLLSNHYGYNERIDHEYQRINKTVSNTNQSITMECSTQTTDTMISNIQMILSKLEQIESKLNNCSEQIESLRNDFNNYQQQHSSPYCQDRQTSTTMNNVSIESGDSAINNDDDLQMTDDQKFLCPKCPFEFPTKYTLNRHLRTHVPGRAYVCGICGNRFKLKSELKQHHRTHSNLKPYKCSRCNYATIRKSDLKRHLVTHSVKKSSNSFKCDHCDYISQRKSDLARHKRRKHPSNEPISESNSSTTISNNVSINRIHTDDKKSSYKCDICSKCFKLKSRFNRHKITHTDEWPFNCTNCSERFRRKDHLNNHIKRKHL
ncbi:uncharacterized protein LOC124494017 [Dermatophagoides farinae]|uniref:uncharacterized protein LOC124494017 n=1 Tax=Dermatophagoides farinae TaxID=6954 RepID=UPI003F5FC6FB